MSLSGSSKNPLNASRRIPGISFLDERQFAVVALANIPASLVLMTVALAMAAIAAVARYGTARIAVSSLTPRVGVTGLIRRLTAHPWLGDALLLLLVYVPLVCVLTLSNAYVADPTLNRFAWVGLGQMLAATVLGVHFSPFALVLPRARLLRYHAFLSRSGFVLVVVHMSLHFDNWVHSDFVAENLKRASMVWGLVAFITLCLLFLTSLPWVRRAAYAFFLAVHNVLFLVLCAFTVMHQYNALPLVLPMLAIFGANKIALGWHLARPVLVRVEQVRPIVPVSSGDAVPVGQEEMDPTAIVDNTNSTAKLRQAAAAPGTRMMDPPSPRASVARVTLSANYLTRVMPDQPVYLIRTPMSTLHPYSPRAHVSFPSPSARSLSTDGGPIDGDNAATADLLLPMHVRSPVTAPSEHLTDPTADIPLASISGGNGKHYTVSSRAGFNPVQSTFSLESASSASTHPHIMSHHRRQLSGHSSFLGNGSGLATGAGGDPTTAGIGSLTELLAGGAAGTSTGNGGVRAPTVQLTARVRGPHTFAARIAPHTTGVVIPPSPPSAVPYFASVVFVAGGSGITAVVGWLDVFAERAAAEAADASWHAHHHASTAARNGGGSSGAGAAATGPRAIITVDRNRDAEAARARRRPAHVWLVWLVRSRADAVALAPDVVALFEHGVYAPWDSLHIKVDIRYTRQDDDESGRSSRPVLDEVVPRVIAPALGFVVGPPSLMAAARLLDRDWWLHEEAYEW
ncbi:hypothetical protein BC828DRAFT_403143 [Blastocladiella britannica]|nr:hypothetical protein BC828DRAFT_403143 [Blastocladiella britannica]